MYHCHSDYSLLDSCTKYQDYIDLAVRDGSKALSISEHGKPLNWFEKWAACRKADLRYIHSVEIYLTESLDEKVRDNYHTVLMAKNMDGFRELNRLVSISCDSDHFYYNNRISFDEFLGISDNIITTSACLASPLNHLQDTHPRYMELANKYDFFEVQPHICEEQAEYNKRLLSLSKKLNKPLIAGTDTHSSTAYKNECRNILMSSKGKSYGNEDGFDLSYKTYDELVDMFCKQGALQREEYIRAIENTNLLYELTEELEIDTSIKYPILYGTREADSKIFVQTAHQMFEDKVSNGIIPPEQKDAFQSAIQEEIRVLQKLNMPGFMLSMSELVRWCKSNGMAIGFGRGSVGGSRVAYVTDIIDVNPETWHTVFSRFANEDREEVGDIDIDCVESDRQRIFAYITERFGADKTAKVASFGTAKAKGVIDDIGRSLANDWKKAHQSMEEQSDQNPWSLPKIAEIKENLTPAIRYADANGKNDTHKKEIIMSSDEYKVLSKKYPELFYYFDGLYATKISQSVHPAGIVISPITLPDNYGVFVKDDENCLFLDMENVHLVGLVKYDFLALKTVQVVRDTCNYVGMPYPKSNEVNWDDADVWNNMAKDSTCIFQFEGNYAFECLKKFKPRNIFEMCLVTACIRPTGASYRDELLARKTHKNPSEMIDKLLKNNLGYLVFQEDTIAFLQQICGLSGSEADNIRRAIGRKQKDRLDAAMPSILSGYCERSDKPRNVAEQEAKEFLQVIEDSASYQFGFNHSIAYCLLSYLCAYYRYHFPIEFITSYLNNAANDDDIKTGTKYANSVGIKITMPKWGVSRSEYFYDKDKNIIAKGLCSVKHMSEKPAEELFTLAHSGAYEYFTDVLSDIDKQTSLNTRQLDILIKLDFFSEFGNQRELLRITEVFYDLFKKGEAKKIPKSKVEGTPFEPIISKYSVGVTKSGGIAKSYTLLDTTSILHEAEDAIKQAGIQDLSEYIKAKNFIDIMGYVGYTSGREEDRKKLYVLEMYPAKRRKDGKQFGYTVLTKSVGSGKEGKFTVFNKTYDKAPIKKGDMIYCKSFERNGQYFTLLDYDMIY